VVSDQTIEHVNNLEQFVFESRRVIKNNGVFYGYFPSRFKAIEPHVGVPLGGVINKKLYYKFCYKVGLCDRKIKSAGELIKYMANDVSYRTDREIMRNFRLHFEDIEFKPELILENIDRNSAKYIRRMPFGTYLFGKLWSKFIICQP
jgi:hypothetical protein